MRFADVFVSEAIIPQLQSDDKDGVVKELIDCLAAAGKVPGALRQPIVDAILERERLGSTGIGRGIAIPHAKHPDLECFAGAVGLSTDGVDFNSLDGSRVHLVFLLVSPQDRSSDHMSLLSRIARKLREDAFCNFLKQATSPREVLQLLDEADSESA